MKKRVNYIDNLRWITVSLLILYHTAMAYNTWGEANYIFFEEVNPIASIVTFILTVVIAYPMTFGLCCAVEAMKRFVKKIAEVRRVEASE